MSDTTADRTPVAITEAEAAVSATALALREARVELTAAETAHAGAADADADAAEQALEAGDELPSPMPSAVLAQRLTLAGAAVKRAEKLHARALVSRDEAYRAADQWRAEVAEAADQAVTGTLEKLAELVAAFDEAKDAAAYARWVATTRNGTPAPRTRLDGLAGPGGEKLLRDLVERHLGITGQRYAQVQREAAQKVAELTAAAEAERAAAVERRQREHEQQQLAEQRNQQRYLDGLAAKVG